MHEMVIQILLFRNTVCYDIIKYTLGCKPSQSLLINIHSQWITSCNKHIDPKIKLKPVNKKRLLQIFLYNIVFAKLKIFN